MKISSAAYTMVEVMVAAVLFLVAATGVLATIVQTRKPAMDSNGRVRAAMYAEKVLGEMHSDIGANTWSSASWTAGTHTLPADAEFSGYNGTYTVTDVGGGKQVSFNITW